MSTAPATLTAYSAAALAFQRVVEWCPVGDASALSATCRALRNVVKTSGIWRHRCDEDFGKESAEARLAVLTARHLEPTWFDVYKNLDSELYRGRSPEAALRFATHQRYEGSAEKILSRHPALANTVLDHCKQRDKHIKERSRQVVVRTFKNGWTAVASYYLSADPHFLVKKYCESPPLVLAAKGGHLPLVQLLLDRGAPVTYSGRISPFHLATARGHYEVAKLLAARGADVDSNAVITGKITGEGSPLRGWPSTLLCWAASEGRTDPMRFLLECGAKPNGMDAQQKTPLQHAVAQNQLGAAELLLDSGASVDAAGGAKTSPLYFAYEAKNKQAARLLLKWGALIDGHAKQGCALLHHAAVAGRLDWIQFLLEQGASVDVRGADNATPFYLACLKGQLQAAQLLLDEGANIGATDRMGRSSLFLACEEGEKKRMEWLLSKGAYVDQKNKRGWTALSQAIHKGDGEAALLLHNAGADLEQAVGPLAPLRPVSADLSQILWALNHDPNSEGAKAPPLHLACERGMLPAVKLLLKGGAKIDAVDSDGNPALLLAVQNGRQKLMELLLSKGAPVDQRGRKGWTCLHTIADPPGDLAALDCLLKSGANVDLPTPDGQTALHLALRARGSATHYEWAAIRLIRKSRCLDARDESGSTALHYAVRTKMDLALRCLVEREARLNLRDGADRTPLHWAATCEDERAKERYDYLKAAGGDDTIKDNQGLTPRDLLAQRDSSSGLLATIKKRWTESVGRLGD